MSDAIQVLIPLAGIAMIFGLGWLISNYLVQRTRAQAQPNGAYQDLAEEAVRGQKELLEEVRRMNDSLREVERLLREV